MKRKTKVYIYNIIVVALLLAGLVWVISRFVHFGNVEFTENAQVHRQVTPVNARVNGFIKEIRFAEYQQVKKGDTLVVIDDAEFRLALAQAEAQLANALAAQNAGSTSVQTVQSNISVTEASIAEAQVNLDIARRDDERYANLLAKKAVTQSEYDRVHAIYLAAEARLKGLKQTKQSTSLAKGEQQHRVEQNQAAVKAAEAAVELAKINLSYSVVLAPCDGITGKKSINVGQMIHAGQTLVDIVDSSDVWIIANYREKQLKHIHVGDTVKIKVDAYPDEVYNGEVTSISDATGAAVSLIPTDNATGNFVKVEQRVPVRIDVDADEADLSLLRAGMSVECEIKY